MVCPPLRWCCVQGGMCSTLLLLQALQKCQLGFLVSLYLLSRICPTCTCTRLVLVLYSFLVFFCSRWGVCPDASIAALQKRSQVPGLSQLWPVENAVSVYRFRDSSLGKIYVTTCTPWTICHPCLPSFTWTHFILTPSPGEYAQLSPATVFLFELRMSSRSIGLSGTSAWGSLVLGGSSPHPGCTGTDLGCANGPNTGGISESSVCIFDVICNVCIFLPLG